MRTHLPSESHKAGESRGCRCWSNLDFRYFWNTEYQMCSCCPAPQGYAECKEELLFGWGVVVSCALLLEIINIGLSVEIKI
uniref:Uncharacterized protein n=1 Tax=Mus spicilegus TaxID=10103 RepID=A0A8C6N5T0_MUSSI